MLREIRHHSKNLFSKLLMILLAASFLLWGIGDIFRANQADGGVATVGKQSIDLADFKDEVAFRENTYRNMLGAQYTPELMQQLGLKRQVLQEMINDRLIRLEAEELGISIPDSTVIEEIRNTDAFHSNGGFDKTTFQAALRNAGVTETRYVEDLKRSRAAKLLAQTFNGQTLVTDQAVEALYQLRNEKRLAELVVFPVDMKVDDTEPSDEELTGYYEEQKEQFRVPEYRKLRTVYFDPAPLRKDVEVTDQQIADLYAERKESYRFPEKRTVEQLLYTEKAKAAEALALLKQQIPIDTVASQVPSTNTDHTLGTITREELMKEAQDQVFALKQGEFSDVVETPFGFHVFHVSEIVPSSLPTQAELQDRLKSELEESTLEDALNRRAEQADDLIAAGVSLDDLAREAGVTVKDIGFVNQQGLGKDGKPVPLSENPQLLPTAFQLEENQLSNLLEDSENGLTVVEVAAIEPSTVPSLDAIKAEVKAGLQKRKAVTARKNLAQQFADAWHKDAAASKPGGTKTQSISLTRMTEALPGNDPLPLTDAFRSALFTVKPGANTDAFATGDGRFIVARLTSVEPAPADAKGRAKALSDLRAELQEQYGNETLQAYLRYLQQKYPVTINRDRIEAPAE